MEEIHLAGHTPERDDKGRTLLIDTHDRPVDDIVWGLFEQAIKRLGPTPTLIEWDSNVPDWPGLKAEADRADAIMVACETERSHAAVG